MPIAFLINKLPPPWQTRWNALKQREQLGILLAAGVLLGAGIVQLLFSAADGREKLNNEVQALRRELAEMNQQRDEWNRLQAMPPRAEAAVGGTLEAAVRASLTAANLKLTARLTGNRQISAQGEAAFDDWLTWVGKLHAEQRLRLTHCDITRLPNPGQVRITAEFSGE